jgi:hypothetical protein
MIRKHLSLLGAGLIALLAACSGDNVIDLPEPLQLPDPGDPDPDPIIPPEQPVVEGPILTKASLKVQVLDQTNRSPLLGAKVILLSTGEVQTTDSAGSVLFEEVHVGSHGTQIELEGYASMVYMAPIDHNSSERVHIATVTFGTALLYPLNASLEGSLFYIGEYNDYTLANGAKVRLTITGGGILNTVYETTVANGKYAFANLPPTTYNLQALQYEVTGGFTYAGISLPSPDLVAGTKVIQTNRDAYSRKIEVPFVVTKHNERIKSTDTVTFEFSAVVDLAKSKVVLTRNVAAVKEWSADKKTLKLFPPAGTKWNSSFVVNLGDVYSVGGAYIGNIGNSGEYEVFLEKQDLTNVLVTGLRCVDINGNTDYCDSTGDKTPATTSVDYINIRWNNVSDADYYNVYAKATRGTGNFILVNDEGPIEGTLVYKIDHEAIIRLGVPAPYYEPFVGNSSIEIIVQAVREDSGDISETSLSRALDGKLTLIGVQVPTP